MDSQELLSILDRMESPDSTFLGWNPPIILRKASGSIIEDHKGKSYIDFCSGFGVMSLGHNSSAFRSMVSEYQGDFAPMVHGMGDVYPSIDKIYFIKKLLGILPDHLTRCSLALSGSQAVEIAMKTCLLHKPKGGFLVFENAYHGVDLGALPLSYRSDFRDPFSEWNKSAEEKVVRLPLHCTKEEVQRAVDLLPYGCAGIFIEPIQGRAGFHKAKSSWLRDLKQVAASNDAFLVFDEIFTGLGRAGQLSRSEDVSADLICLGKAIGGGLPLSVCCGTEKAFAVWPKSQGEAIHTGTFFGHPMSCNLGAKVIDAIINEELCQRSCELGDRSLTFLKERISHLSEVQEVRGCGLMIAIEFTKVGFGVEVMNRLAEVGVISLVSGDQGKCISITPALNIPEKTLFDGLEKIESVLRGAH